MCSSRTSGHVWVMRLTGQSPLSATRLSSTLVQLSLAYATILVSAPSCSEEQCFLPDEQLQWVQGQGIIMLRDPEEPVHLPWQKLP